MKKAIVLLLALAVLGGAAFAAPTIGGLFIYDSSIDADGYATDLFLSRINMKAANEEGTVGFNARFQTADVTESLGNTWAYGYGKFLDGMITVIGGKYTTYSTYLTTNLSHMNSGTIGTSYISGKIGAFVELAPIDGLMIGGGLQADEGTISVGDFLLEATYGIADTADIVVYGNFDDEVADSTLELGVSVSAIENVTAIVGYKGLASHGVFGIFGYGLDTLYGEAGVELTFGDTLGYFIEGGVDFFLEPCDIYVYGSFDGDAYYASAMVSKNGWQAGFAMNDGAWQIPFRFITGF